MRFVLALSFLLSIISCAPMNIEQFQNKNPRLVLEEYFAQPLSGRGAFFGRSGELKTRFMVHTTGAWDGNVLTLKEQLRYESGEEHQRTFRIKKLDANHYEAACDDFVGVGTIEAAGDALHWNYYLKEQSKQAKGITLHFDDWMFLAEDGFIINRAWASKFGLGVGEVFISLAPGGK